MTHDNHQSINKVSLTEKAQGAFLGAAVGDALGWPQEDRSSRVGTQTQTNPQVPVAVFQRWTRRAGGRYYSHEETILPGEYSDDTQLLICTARSLLHSTQWWHHLARRELPLWTLYERGGGKATKRAAEIWLAGREPWSAGEKTDRKNYYEAGGNGVAMRIMPHCLLGGAEAEFGNIARNIVADGLCTHGHPRALVGALAYGYAVCGQHSERQVPSIMVPSLRKHCLRLSPGQSCQMWMPSGQIGGVQPRKCTLGSTGRIGKQPSLKCSVSLSNAERR